MNERIDNDLYISIIAHVIEEMKIEKGEKFILEKINLAEVERRTGISRARLRRLKKNGFKDLPHKKIGQHPKTTILSEYTDVIDKMLMKGITNSARILSLIQELGYSGSLTTLKNYIASHKHLLPPLRKIAFPKGNRGRRYATNPGEAYQMDWGFVNVIDEEQEQNRIACFAMICHHCGKKYIEFFPNAKQENLFIGMIHAFQYMGIPKTVLTDNMKSVVIKRDLDGKPVWQKDYDEFMKVLDFKTNLCKPHHPFTKGKVERLVRFVKDNFIPGCSFKDLTDLNQKALEWCQSQDNQYRRTIDNTSEALHTTKCSLELKNVAEELEILKYLCPIRKISFDGFVEYEGRRFGTPYTYDGRSARVCRKKNEILIYSEDLTKLLVCHPVTWDKTDSYCLNQYLSPEQPEEFPTAPIRVSMKKIQDSTLIPPGFGKYNFFDEEDDGDE